MVARRSAAWKAGLQPSPRDKARALRMPSAEWRRYLGDPQMQAGYHAKVCRASECWFWTGALSASGHGRLRVPAHLGTRVVASHVYGYQLVYGVLVLDASGLAVVRHRCDNASCHRPSHWVTGDAAANAADYAERREDPLSPLADRRGAGSRARAIRAAILRAQAEGRDVERAIRSAMEAGMPGAQQTLAFGG